MLSNRRDTPYEEHNIQCHLPQVLLYGNTMFNRTYDMVRSIAFITQCHTHILCNV